MADISFHHGTRVFESQEVPVLIRTMQSAVIAHIGTAPDADANVFPLNKPVLIKGAAEYSKVAALGDDGTLKDSLDGAFDQIGTYNYIIRVEEGADMAATLANLVGDGTALTGVHALKKCEGLYGRKLRPRIVVVPGFTASLASDGISGIAVTQAGTGYGPNTVVTVAGDGIGTELIPLITAGTITGIAIKKPGFGFTEAPTLTITDPDGGGAGATATATIGTVGNPVIAELIGILEKLRAVAFVDGPDTTDAAAVLWREQINSDRI